MVDKITRTTKRTPKTPSTEEQPEKPLALKAKPDNDQGAPIEHHHVEPTDKHVDNQGDLEQETLDRNAPYNRTYGIVDE